MATKLTLPQKKFKGAEDPEGIRSYLRYFQLYIEVNGWADEAAGKYLTISLEGDAQAFLFELPEDCRKSYQSLSKKLIQRYEGGLAVLKYIRDWQQRTRKKGEPLNTYLTDLRVMYDRAFPMLKVEDLGDEDKNKIRLDGARAAYDVSKEFAIKAQFINGLEPNVRDVLVCDEDIMDKTMDQVIRRVAGLETERNTPAVVQKPVVAASTVGLADNDTPSDVTEIQRIILEEVEKSLALVQGTWIPRGRGRGRGRYPRRRGSGPKPSDICHKCGGKGHWQSRCPSLNESGAV